MVTIKFFYFPESESQEMFDLQEKYKQGGWGYISKYDADKNNNDIRNLIIYNEHVCHPTNLGNMHQQFTLEECLKILSGPLEFGNQKQIDAKKVLDYMNLLYNISHTGEQTLKKLNLL